MILSGHPFFGINFKFFKFDPSKLIMRRGTEKSMSLMIACFPGWRYQKVPHWKMFQTFKYKASLRPSSNCWTGRSFLWIHQFWVHNLWVKTYESKRMSQNEWVIAWVIRIWRSPNCRKRDVLAKNTSNEEPRSIKTDHLKRWFEILQITKKNRLFELYLNDFILTSSWSLHDEVFIQPNSLRL